MHPSRLPARIYGYTHVDGTPWQSSNPPQSLRSAERRSSHRTASCRCEGAHGRWVKGCGTGLIPQGNGPATGHPACRDGDTGGRRGTDDDAAHRRLRKRSRAAVCRWTSRCHCGHCRRLDHLFPIADDLNAQRCRCKAPGGHAAVGGPGDTDAGAPTSGDCTCSGGHASDSRRARSGKARKGPSRVSRSTDGYRNRKAQGKAVGCLLRRLRFLRASARVVRFDVYLRSNVE